MLNRFAKNACHEPERWTQESRKQTHGEHLSLMFSIPHGWGRRLLADL